MAGKKGTFLRKLVISIVVLLLLTGLGGGYWAYRNFYQSNVKLGERKSVIIYIPTGSTFADVMKILEEANILGNRASFMWLAERKGYVRMVKPGKYRVLAGMSNNALVNLLLSGIQEEISLNYTGLYTLDQFIGRAGRRLESDSAALHDFIFDEGTLSRYGFSENNVQALFIPGTLKFYWNTSPQQFLDKVAERYRGFWNDARKKAANEIGLSQTEVTILASIVQGEQCCDTLEQRTIAGLYLNRLRDDMLLQSDPTVIYAIGDFSIQRVSFEQTRVRSPYNTYLNKGLPPGPISFARPEAIDAVLDAGRHDYLYMCAKDDLTGKHCFAETYEQHKENARRYRQALDKLGIH